MPTSNLWRAAGDRLELLPSLMAELVQLKVDVVVTFVEVVNTYEGTHDVHALILGRAITGIAAF